MKVYNRLGNRYSGALGKEVVASSWKGHHYLRAYVVPEDPKSELQLQHRAIFRRAAEAWKKLLPRQKMFYNRIADGMTGYNVFLGRYVAAERGGEEPETPLLTVWRTDDERPVADGWLLVSRGRQNLFVDSLRDSKVEIALTRSDVPYTFVLKKGAVEDSVLAVDQWPEGGLPTTIESKKLGIRLIANPSRDPGHEASETGKTSGQELHEPSQSVAPPSVGTTTPVVPRDGGIREESGQSPRNPPDCSS